VKITQSDIPAPVDKLDDIPIDILSPERKVRHSHMPSLVAFIQHLTDLIHRFLVRHTLVLEDKDDIAIFSLNEVLAIGA
jgi:hypothetical protein